MRYSAALVLGACGRLAFDPLERAGDGGIDSPVDGVEADAPASTFVYLHGEAATAANGTQLGVMLPAQALGGLRVVAVGIGGPMVSLASVTDDAGNVYELAIGPTSSSGLTQWIYTSRVTNVTSPNTVLATFDNTATQPGLLVADYGGVATTMTVHTTSGLSGSGTLSESGPLMIAIAPALIVSANTNSQGGTAGPGAGYTQRLLNMFEDILEDRVVSSPGTYVADAPLTTQHEWVMQAIVLAPSD
ncbi:MAG: hypothetical protein ACKV2T_14930 [Kofleriaceae bacterium]